MTQVIEFVSKTNIDAKKNLSSFIQKNQLGFLFESNKWEDNVWDLTTFLAKKAINTRSQKMYFRSITDTSISKNKIEIALTQPLLDFAKATFCEIMRVKKLKEFKRIIYAIQALEFALLEQNKPVCVTEVDFDTLRIAESYLREKYQDPWSVAKNLENIVNNFILKKELNPHLTEWKTTITYQAPTRNDRVKTFGTEDNQSKLPHLEELIALAEIYNSSTHIPDKVTTCFVILALFAPSRASEILSLPTNCIVNNNYSFTEERADGNTQQPPIGLSWRPVKGGDPLVKYAVNEEYGNLAIEAINYLIKLGESAREAAKWYSQNPNKLYLPTHLEHLRNQPISLWEVSQILGKAHTISADHAFRYGFSKPLSKTGDKQRMHNKNASWVSLYNFKELEKFIISTLPKSFPILDGRVQQYWHDSLFVLPKHILTPDVDILNYIPTSIDINQINKQLGSNPGQNTIFSRNGKQLESGKAMYITTHQFRHLLNTLAQSKSLSQELIAFWSGRKNVKQNDAYNHVSQEAIIDRYKFLQGQSETISQFGDLRNKVSSIAKINSISYDDALKIELGSIHITRYGICRHDYSLTPCPKDKDCGNCGEFSVMKGSEKHLLEANNQVKLLKQALSNAESADKDGHSGAKRWIELNKPKLERWQKFLAFLEDESIPNGSMYTLQDSEDSHQSKVGLAFEVRDLNITEKASKESHILNLLKS